MIAVKIPGLPSLSAAPGFGGMGKCLQTNQSIYIEENLLLRAAAAAPALCGAAGTTVRAAHALFAVLLGTVHIESRQTENQNNYRNDDSIG